MARTVVEKFNVKWQPDIGSEESVEPNVKQIKFGDGYEARIASGINSVSSQWSVGFSVNLQTRNDILAFLKRHGGLKSFAWTTPTGETILVVCRNWKSQQKGFGLYQVSATFEQVFESVVMPS